MDKVRYPYLYSDFHNDASDEDLQVDHNRCILCLRCIRVCGEKVGAHTLDLEKRGWNASVVSDLGKVLGESDTCSLWSLRSGLSYRNDYNPGFCLSWTP